jgi:hypothetical protein
MIRVLVKLGAAAFLFVATLETAGAGDLTGREIEAELVGRQIMWWQADGWQNGTLTLGSGGVADITIAGPGTRSHDEGTWELRSGTLCTKWRMLRAQEKCYRLTRGDSGRFLTSGGNIFEIQEAGV